MGWMDHKTLGANVYELIKGKAYLGDPCLTESYKVWVGELVSPALGQGR
jgi:hypothetical protein